VVAYLNKEICPCRVTEQEMSRVRIPEHKSAADALLNEKLAVFEFLNTNLPLTRY
jgi:hypothetical protein